MCACVRVWRVSTQPPTSQQTHLQRCHSVLRLVASGHDPLQPLLGSGVLLAQIRQLLARRVGGLARRLARLVLRLLLRPVLRHVADHASLLAAQRLQRRLHGGHLGLQPRQIRRSRGGGAIGGRGHHRRVSGRRGGAERGQLRLQLLDARQSLLSSVCRLEVAVLVGLHRLLQRVDLLLRHRRLVLQLGHPDLQPLQLRVRGVEVDGQRVVFVHEVADGVASIRVAMALRRSGTRRQLQLCGLDVDHVHAVGFDAEP